MLIIKKILGQIRKAVEDYNLISDGDKIAVGVSGGKDSTTLLNALKRFQSFYPKKFELVAITLTMGMGNADFTPIKELCKDIDVEYHIEETLIGKIVFEERDEKNPCSLCANLRRGALNTAAMKYNCNKVALGHHKDDLIETFMLSLLYEGRINTFLPTTYLDRTKLHVIRPLIYTKEHEIRSYIKKQNLPIIKSCCEIDGKTKRQYVKELLEELTVTNRDAKTNVFGAIKRSHLLNGQ